jgi:hypothetical protein
MKRCRQRATEGKESLRMVDTNFRLEVTSAIMADSEVIQCKL